MRNRHVLRTVVAGSLAVALLAGGGVALALRLNGDAHPSGGALTGNGSFFHPLGGQPVKEDSSAGCRVLIDPPLPLPTKPTGICGIVHMAGGPIAWVREQTHGVDTIDSFVRLYRLDAASHRWMPWLEARSTFVFPNGGLSRTATIKAADITGDGRPELVIGWRDATPMHNLWIDIVTYAQGSSPVLTHLGPAPYGSVGLSKDGIDEYVGVFPERHPANAPPSSFLHRVIRWDGQVFRVVDAGQVAPKDVPTSDV